MSSVIKQHIQPTPETVAEEDGFNAQLDYLDQRVPHLVKAANIRAKLHSLEETLDSVVMMINSVPVSAMLLKEDCGICYLNKAAEQLLENSDHIMERSGKLELSGLQNFDLRKSVKCVIAQVRNNDIDTAANVTLCRNRRGHAVYEFILQPVMTGNHNVGLQYQNPLVFLCINEVQSATQLNEVALKELFDLSAKEVELVNHLARGATLNEISELTGKSRNTLKTQLNSIFSKTDTSTQVQLVARLLGSLAVLDL